MIENTDFLGEVSPEIKRELPRRSTRQSLSNRFEQECRSGSKEQSEKDPGQLSQSFASWCDSFSSSLPNVNPKRALRNGAEKISQTLNNVRVTFDTLSQKLRKSTRRRQPLKNVESPKTPVTPYTRSRNMLGRTPTKLYSPFSIETPGKENVRRRTPIKRTSPLKPVRANSKKKTKNQKGGLSLLQDGNAACYSPDMKFSNDLFQTQIGIYEFQSTANKIIQKTTKD